MSEMSVSQRNAWLWAAALAPAAAIVPSAAARAGAGGWVVPMLALPGVLVADRLLRRVIDGGLAHSFCRMLGARPGRVLTIIYIMWAALLGGVQLRMCARRLAAVEPAEGSWLATVAVVVLAVWFASKPPAATARWAVLVLGWLLVGLVAIAGLALVQVRRDNLVPLWSDWRGLPGAAASVLGVLCVRMYGGFLRAHTEPESGRWIRLPVTVCTVLTVVLLAVQGCLGAELAARLENPLLTLSRNVGVDGAVQRAESLVVAVLLLADLALVTLLLWAIAGGIEQAWCGNAIRTRIVAAGAMLGWAAVSGGVPLQMIHRLVSVGNLLLGVGVPLLMLVIMRIRKGKQGAHLVSENEKNGTY